MISRGVPDLHPDSSKFYWLQWSQSELGDGVTIDSVAWTVPAELTNNNEGQSALSVGIQLGVGTGTAGNYYDVECEIETSGGETLHEILRITVSTEGH